MTDDDDEEKIEIIQFPFINKELEKDKDKLVFHY